MLKLWSLYFISFASYVYWNSLPLQRYIDEVYRGYTWTPINGTDYRWADRESWIMNKNQPAVAQWGLQAQMIHSKTHHLFVSPIHTGILSGCCHLQSRSSITILQWVLHQGRSERCDAAAPVWVHGGRVFRFTSKETRSISHSLFFRVTDMQSLLPSSFESSGHVFLAPRWLSSSVMISFFSKRKVLIYAAVSAGNTASVCSFLTTTPSSCRTFCLSCLTSPLNLMSVSALTEWKYLTAVDTPIRYSPHFFKIFCRWPWPDPQPDFWF